MKHEKFIHSYDKIQPDGAEKDRMRDAVLRCGRSQKELRSGEVHIRTRWRKRMIVPLAACFALLLAVAAAGGAVYQRWFLPEPMPYEQGSNGIFDVQGEKDYTWEQLPQDGSSEENEQLTDADFIQKAVEILKLAGLTDVDTQAMRVRRQTHLKYGREEAEVFFTENEVKTTVCFHAGTGTLLSLSSIDWIEAEGQACATEEEGGKAAQGYYETLPVEQGYTLTGCTQYDEQYWSFEFTREVADGLYNAYEAVRIAINPLNGRLAGCNVFFFPLLDDHLEGDEPLTQEEAEKIAQTVMGKQVTNGNFVLESAEITVALPNWMFTENSGIDLEYSKVSRLSWTLTYHEPHREFASKIYVNIDLYTGEILGGDATR